MDDTCKDILRVLFRRVKTEEIRELIDLWESQSIPSMNVDSRPSEEEEIDFIEGGSPLMDHYVEGCVSENDDEVIIAYRNELTDLIYKRISYLIGDNYMWVKNYDVNHEPLIIDSDTTNRYYVIDRYIENKVKNIINHKEKEDSIVMRPHTYMFEDPEKTKLVPFYKASFVLERVI